MERYGAIESVLRAEIVELGAALDAEREKVKGLKKRLAEEHPGLDEVCDERDAMILQMGEQAAVLAKENMAVKAQLRQVEGERNTARHRVDELEAREIDVEILQGDLTLLRQLVEALDKMTPQRPNAITWEKGVEILDYVQDKLLPVYRAALAAQDASMWIPMRSNNGRIHNCRCGHDRLEPKE